MVCQRDEILPNPVTLITFCLQKCFLTFGVFEGENEAEGGVCVFADPHGVDQLGQEVLVSVDKVIGNRV